MAAITKRIVDAMKPGELVWSGSFGCKALATGERVYILDYRIGGRKRRYTLGRHGRPWTATTAAKEANRLRQLVAQGVDPLAQKQAARTGPTMADLADRFVREHVDAKLKPSTGRAYRQLLDAIIRPKLGARRIADVTPDDLARLHHGLQASPYAANRTIAVVGKMLGLAERWGLRARGTNPARGLEKFRERGRARTLSADELARLGAVLARAERDGAVAPKDGAPAVPVSPFVLASLRLAIFTGMRKGEVLALEWPHVDVASACLRIPVHKTDRAGAKVIPLNGPALDVLGALPRLEGSTFVFPSLVREGRHLVNIEKGWRALRAAAGLRDVRVHDLRHLHASTGVSLGVSLPIVGSLLGHAVPSTTQRYARVATSPARQASELIGERLAQALAGGQ